MLQTFFNTDQNVAALVLRLMLALVILPHGAQKVLGWFGGHGWKGTWGFFKGLGLPSIAILLVFAAEFLGPLGLITGFLTRLAALGIALTMLGAIWIAHRKVGFFMNWSGQQKGEGYEFHLLAIAMAAALIVLGAGPLSIDRWLAGLLGA